MKHGFLRRLSALALALAMAAGLCAAPAWAADPPNPEFSTRLVIFKSASEQTPYSLTVLNVVEGDTIDWTVSGNVTLNISKTSTTVEKEGAALTGNTVEVSTSANTSTGKVTATVRRDGQPVGSPLSCDVYCGTAPFIIAPAADSSKNLPNMTAGESKQFTISFDANIRVNPEDIVVTSSNRSVAAIEAVSPPMSGNSFRATIKAADSVTYPDNTTIIRLDFKNGGYYDEWKLTVDPAPDPVPVTSVTIETDYLEMTAKETHDALKAVVKPDDATNKTVTWRSSDSRVVTVDESGKITAVGAGRASIYAVAGGVQSNSCIVVVKAADNSVTLSSTALLLDTTDRNEAAKRLVATADPAEGTTFAWSTGNAAVADFDGSSTAEGAAVNVCGKKEGTTVITVTATFTDAKGVKTTKSAECSVTVLDADSEPVNQITLSETSHSMPADGTFNLSVISFNPSNALDKSIIWTSSDVAKEYADWEVVNPTTIKITAKKAGTVRFTASANFGGANKICEVTITPKAETITLNGFDYDSNTTGTNKYTYTFRDSGNNYFSVRAVLGPAGTADPVHWASQDTSVVTVSNTTGTQATVTVAGPGRTKITAVPMDHDGKDRKLESGPAEITVTVSGVIIVNDESTPITSLALMQSQYRQIEAQVLGSANNGDLNVDWISSDPSVVSVSTRNSATTTITARRAGTATITATKGNYTATCSVTVTEDTAGIIEGITTPPGVAYGFSNLASRLQSACSAKTGASLDYVTNLSVSSTDQGILHDKHYSSDNTGAGVGVQDRYYPGTPPQGQRSLSDLSFVPRTTFSGTAEINYTAWSTNNKSVNGIIRITVSGTGDVTYSANAGSAVNFQASDFSRVHSNLRSVSFTPPLESAGILYYKYTTPSQPGTRVTAGDAYRRTGAPNLDDVSFVPAAGYQGSVKINYKGTDTSGRTITGVVTINVTNDSGSGSSLADLFYSVQKESWVTFRPGDFSTACRYALGESLSYVRFTQPPSGEGTLFYNYKGFSDFDGTVSPTTSYYYSGTPALNRVSFVSTTTTPSRVDIPYTGYTTRGNTFTGTVHIILGGAGTGVGSAEQGGLRYTVSTGRSVNFNTGDFNAACFTALGRNLASIQFNSLPSANQGALRFTRGNSSMPSSVSTGTRFFSTGNSTSNLIGNVFFQAYSGYTGTFTIPFTGTGDDGSTFTDVVTIVVTPPTFQEITYSGTTANPIRLYSSHVVSAANGVLNGTLSYIIFNNLPDTTAGKLYLNYRGLGTGTQVAAGTRYYISGTPGIDQISFVPRGRYTGQVGVGFTAVNTNGQSVSGRIMFSITSTGNSTFFNDMYNHTWAAPSVDYLYQNDIVKGTTATTFGPSRHIKRCDFVLMLCRAFRFNGVSGYSFADVPVDSYYAQAVAAAKQLGIVSGDGASFRPNSELTRQDAMVMIYNALNAAGRNVAPASASVLNQFADSGSVSGYARNAVSALVQLGAVNGSTGGRLNPRSPITRAEAAVILHFIMTM